LLPEVTFALRMSRPAVAGVRCRDVGDMSAAVAVHDRYQNYDAFTAVMHQLCCAHLLRDLEDAAESYPGAIWPGQASDALRALIHAANKAREQGLDAIPPA
jgi:transposase